MAAFNHPGAILRALRLERGLSLLQGAEELGISEGHLSRIETGSRRPSRLLVARLKKHYGLPGAIWDLEATESVAGASAEAGAAHV